MRPPRSKSRRARAFTLMEILIATVAFAIVLAAINGVFYGALRLRNKSAAALDAAVPLQHTLAIIQRDLAGIVPPGGPLSGALQTSASASSSMSSRTTGALPGQSRISWF